MQRFAKELNALQADVIIAPTTSFRLSIHPSPSPAFAGHDRARPTGTNGAVNP
jgi:hypothetical protein